MSHIRFPRDVWRLLSNSSITPPHAPPPSPLPEALREGGVAGVVEGLAHRERRLPPLECLGLGNRDGGEHKSGTTRCHNITETCDTRHATTRCDEPPKTSHRAKPRRPQSASHLRECFAPHLCFLLKQSAPGKIYSCLVTSKKVDFSEPFTTWELQKSSGKNSPNFAKNLHFVSRLTPQNLIFVTLAHVLSLRGDSRAFLS